MIKTISAPISYEALTHDTAIIIDVREDHEFQEMRIDGAHHAPLSILPEAIQKIDLEPHRNKKIIFQCLKGGRSAQAIDYLQNGFLKDYDLYNLEGGILSWIDHDLPVIK